MAGHVSDQMARRGPVGHGELYARRRRAPRDISMTAAFERLDRDARLAVLRDVQHHAGIESDNILSWPGFTNFC